jgi:hypothetical protein
LPGDDDVMRRARIREVAQAAFPASRVGAALTRLYKATVQRQQSVQFRVESSVSQCEKQFSEESGSAQRVMGRTRKEDFTRAVVQR